LNIEKSFGNCSSSSDLKKKVSDPIEVLLDPDSSNPDPEHWQPHSTIGGQVLVPMSSLMLAL
jgi:hypothetical protein